jgi:hypothetical protein
MPNKTDNGKIWRQNDGLVVVEILGKAHLLDQPGVICINPQDPEKDRRYQKTFDVKKIYLPGEYQRAIQEIVSHEDNFVLSMNGYSSITDEQCRRYGIKPGEYEAACAAIMRTAIAHLRKKFQGAQLKLVFGASDMGVDAAIEKVAREFNITPLGFSCPEFMFYVKDDDFPVYVGASPAEYADRYIESLDLLIATGGREHAFIHDIHATLRYKRHIHFIDVLNSLSTTGGVPATIIDSDGTVRVDNAAAAFGQHISFFSREDSTVHAPANGDRWDAIFENVCSITTQECRKKMSAKRKFN